MAQVCAATGAQRFDPFHAEAGIAPLLDGARHGGLRKARPAAAGVELGARLEQLGAAADAVVAAVLPVLLELARKRALGGGVAGDLVGLQGLLAQSRLPLNYESNSLLCKACSLGHLDIIQYLLRGSADPNEPSLQPIRLAVGCKQMHVVKALLDPVTGLNADSVHEAFRLGCEGGNLEVAQAALGNPLCNVNKIFRSSLLRTNGFNMACISGNEELVRLIMGHPNFIPTAVKVENPFFSTVEWPSIVRILLRMGLFNPSAFRNQAILRAIRKGNVESVRLLLGDSRVSLKGQGDQALRLAVEGSHIPVVELLLDCPDIDPTGKHQYDLIEGLDPERQPSHGEILKLFLQHPAVSPRAVQFFSKLPTAFQRRIELIEAVRDGLPLANFVIQSMEVLEWIFGYLVKDRRDAVALQGLLCTLYGMSRHWSAGLLVQKVGKFRLLQLAIMRHAFFPFEILGHILRHLIEHHY